MSARIKPEHIELVKKWARANGKDLTGIENLPYWSLVPLLHKLVEDELVGRKLRPRYNGERQTSNEQWRETLQEDLEHQRLVEKTSKEQSSAARRALWMQARP